MENMKYAIQKGHTKQIRERKKSFPFNVRMINMDGWMLNRNFFHPRSLKPFKIIAKSKWKSYIRLQV